MPSFYPQEDLMHDAAHFGGTYAVTHISETLCHRYYDEKLACLLGAVIFSNVLNIGRKAVEGFPNDTTRASVTGFLGSLAAGVTIEFQ